MANGFSQLRDDKRNVVWLFKQSLNAFKFFQHRFNFDSTCFNTVERGDAEAVCAGLQSNNFSLPNFVHVSRKNDAEISRVIQQEKKENRVKKRKVGENGK